MDAQEAAGASQAGRMPAENERNPDGDNPAIADQWSGESIQCFDPFQEKKEGDGKSQ